MAPREGTAICLSINQSTLLSGWWDICAFTEKAVYWRILERGCRWVVPLWKCIAAHSGIEVMDHRQLDFDKPEPGSETRRGQPGAKRYKNRRWLFAIVQSFWKILISQIHLWSCVSDGCKSGSCVWSDCETFVARSFGWIQCDDIRLWCECAVGEIDTNWWLTFIGYWMW